MNFQPLGFYFINSPLRPFFRDFQIGPQAQILPSCHYPLTHRKKQAKRQYTTVRGFRKCLWGIPGVAGLACNPDTNSMVLLFWDGGSISDWRWCFFCFISATSCLFHPNRDTLVQQTSVLEEVFQYNENTAFGSKLNV